MHVISYSESEVGEDLHKSLADGRIHLLQDKQKTLYIHTCTYSRYVWYVHTYKHMST